MTTKELIEWLKAWKGDLSKPQWCTFQEIIKRLEEHDEMKKGIHEISQIVRILKKG